MSTMPTSAELQRERPYLMGIAYRMLGSASDAEDVVQEALLRAAHGGELRSIRAFLTTVVTRLCLDELGSARRRRETYVGPYLPEPVATDALDAPGADAPERRENVSLALLVLLDELSPLERAVFVLRDVFDLEFSEIGAALERSESACRKLLQRAREHIAAAQPMAAAPADAQHAVCNAFYHALATGDLQALVEVLAEDASMRVDHGGKASAARKPLSGSDTVSRFLLGLIAKGQRAQEAYSVALLPLNGAPGMVLKDDSGATIATFTLRISQLASGPRITDVYVMRNPDKLQALASGARIAINPHTPHT
jgi:RNA polymerase sigma-70 factor (ECF subfamily)